MQRTQARIVDVELNDIHDVDADKGEFIEMDPSYLTNMFKDLVTEEGYELGWAPSSTWVKRTAPTIMRNAIPASRMIGMRYSPRNINY